MWNWIPWNTREVKFTGPQSILVRSFYLHSSWHQGQQADDWVSAAHVDTRYSCWRQRDADCLDPSYQYSWVTRQLAADTRQRLSVQWSQPDAAASDDRDTQATTKHNGVRLHSSVNSVEFFSVTVSVTVIRFQFQSLFFSNYFNLFGFLLQLQLFSISINFTENKHVLFNWHHTSTPRSISIFATKVHSLYVHCHCTLLATQNTQNQVTHTARKACISSFS